MPHQVFFHVRKKGAGMLYEVQLDWIRAIHQVLRTGILDSFFSFINYFDRIEFLYLLIPSTWLFCGRKAALRLIAALCLSRIINVELKHFFASPRPFHMDPSLMVIDIKGFGFPSGAAQTVGLLSLLLLKYWKSGWKWVVVPLYAVTVSFSRVYLGVHFPMDIVGGWIVGCGLYLTYVYVFPLLERAVDIRLLSK